MTELDQAMNIRLATLVGTSESGLVGPFAFPRQCTWQRSRGGRRSSRRKMHRNWCVKGIPLFIEAVPVPCEPLKGILRVLGERLQEHYELHIGELFFVLFAGSERDSISTDEAVVDFVRPLEMDQCPRFGSQNLVNVWREWFYRRFAEMQHRAVANGGYFPPPRLLRARVHRETGVRVEIGFSRGFMPQDRLLVVDVPLRYRQSRR